MNYHVLNNVIITCQIYEIFIEKMIIFRPRLSNTSSRLYTINSCSCIYHAAQDFQLSMQL